MKKGTDHTVTIPFEASPLPEVEWSWNEQNLLPKTVHSNVDCEASVVQLEIHNVQPSDAGHFEMKVKNPLGSANVEVDLTILDVPSAPQNLQADVDQNLNVTLAWNEPESDGGDQITDYSIEQNEIGTKNWLPIVIVTAPDTHCEISKLPEEKVYNFSVCAMNSVGKSEPCQLQEPIVIKKPFGKHYFYVRCSLLTVK